MCVPPHDVATFLRSGRWRSSYTIELASPESLNASIEVQVHYFENGNVQLSSSRPTSLALTPSPSQGSSHPTPESLAADPIAFGRAVQHTIAKHEAEYQEALDEAYSNLSERAFKALRRQLPVTRQKIDWDKVCLIVSKLYNAAYGLHTTGCGIKGTRPEAVRGRSAYSGEAERPAARGPIYFAVAV